MGSCSGRADKALVLQRDLLPASDTQIEQPALRLEDLEVWRAEVSQPVVAAPAAG